VAKVGNLPEEMTAIFVDFCQNLRICDSGPIRISYMWFHKITVIYAVTNYNLKLVIWQFKKAVRRGA